MRLLWPVAYVFATLHSILRHGGAGPQISTDSHGRQVLRCLICGLTFWREKP
jgi:hypothetical protein